jgi:hypothetical protein
MGRPRSTRCASCAAPAQLPQGTIEGNVYTCESAELTFTAPDGWKYATDEEKAERLGVSVDIVNKAGAKTSEKKYRLDMYATNPATGTTVVVVYQSLISPGGIFMNEENFFDATREELNKAALYNYEFSDYTEAKIGSNTFKLMTITYTDYDYIKYLYARRTGYYMLSIGAVVNGDDDIESVMACFS